MKCEICHRNDAVRAIKRKSEGVEHELYVCESCARTSTASVSAGVGPLPGMPTSLTDVLFSLGAQLGDSSKVEDQVCPVCGLTREEVRKSRRLGCPKCFDIFETDLRTFLSVNAFATLPADGAAMSADGVLDIPQLKAQLAIAVSEERYEDAAKICEKIRKLGGHTEQDGHNG